MNRLIIDDMPEIYEKVKEYIDHLESLGFIKDDCFDDFEKHNEDNYSFYNGWKYPVPVTTLACRDEVVVDLVSYTGEPKIEVYKYRIKKPTNHYREMYQDKSLPFMLVNKAKELKYESVIVDNISDFKKEIGKFLVTVRKFKERIRLHEVETDFS